MLDSAIGLAVSAIKKGSHSPFSNVLSDRSPGDISDQVRRPLRLPSTPRTDHGKGPAFFASRMRWLASSILSSGALLANVRDCRTLFLTRSRLKFQEAKGRSPGGRIR